ncbi:MAG: thymidylate synthase [Syntrophales bacterium]|nr:thymidylate synthase [Syntrophales bacterium]MDD5641801.1 thymidylate synthase [Syntrophales bacterium]
MEFKPLYFADRLTVINPQGTIGMVTLWSKVDYVIARFREAGVDLDPATSPIAVFGTLYGNGLREMLRNLLYNPQIQMIIGCGNDRSGSWEELYNFFHYDLEPIESNLVRYVKPEGLDKVSSCRIPHTNRIIDDLVKRDHFHGHVRRRPRLVPPDVFGDLTEKGPIKEIQRVFQDFGHAFERRDVTESDRIIIPLPELEVQYFPSSPRGHVVVRDTILEAWKEVLHLLTRFGRRVTLKKGDRLELQHVKVVVEKPRLEAEEKLKAVHLDPQKLRSYQENILKGEMRPDETYNYGHRLRTHFGLDTLAACVERFKKDPEDRKAYVALWDTKRDLKVKEGRPCLVSLFFRKFEGKLTLSATFRTHNAMDAYPLNLYGLMAIQNWVAERVGLPPGAITVISHSLGLDPKELDRALMVISKRPFKVRLDPMGYFRITLDGKDILVEHRFEDVTLKEYRGKKAERLQHEIARDVALSDINHAIYLGRQLAKAEMALKEGREFVQD